ncbi:hypothetical protein I634_03125 [Alteromonas mediterranea U8]|nr:hypothetical protein I634_03125 [Alteromonas mediterranea U8]
MSPELKVRSFAATTSRKATYLNFEIKIKQPCAKADVRLLDKRASLETGDAECWRCGVEKAVAKAETTEKEA